MPSFLFFWKPTSNKFYGVRYQMTRNFDLIRNKPYNNFHANMWMQKKKKEARRIGIIISTSPRHVSLLH